MVAIYVFQFCVVSNSWVKFYYSCICFSICTAYYITRNFFRYGLEDGLLVFVVFGALVIVNFFYCYENEVSLRESFTQTELIKQFRDSMQSVLEVFPEGILVKHGSTHHYSNEALAQKLNSNRDEFGHSFGQVLEASPAYLIEE